MENARKIDYMGAATSTTAMILLLIPISSGGTYFQWDSPMLISMLTLGIAALSLFVVVEKKYARLPMIPCKRFNILNHGLLTNSLQ